MAAVAAVPSYCVSYSLTATPSAINFGSVSVGKTSVQAVVLTNTGTGNLNIASDSLTAAGFAITGLALPQTLSPGQSSTFTVSFAPASAGTYSATLSLLRTNGMSITSILLSGSATVPLGILTETPSSLTFGNVMTGSSSTQTVILGNSGNANVALAAATMSGAGFRVTGLTLPATIAPGQNIKFYVSFAPSSTGSVTGSVKLLDSSGKVLGTVALSGSGVAPLGHTATVSWNASASTVLGYNVYRSTQNGGPYTKVNSSVDGSLSFSDATVSSGQTYYYVVTSISSTGYESGYSAQVTAVIPTP
ncbi:MAG: choice-of-anchor D domain-containing protein [Terriglobales bacterium]